MNNRTTRGANFNYTEPDDVELLAWLDSFGNASETIKRALRAYKGGVVSAQPIRATDDDDPPFTRQERSALVAEVASLRQRLEVPAQPDAGSAQETEQPDQTSQPPIPTGRELPQIFLDNVRKAAKPGIRLE
jgi:hypothetical protein